MKVVLSRRALADLDRILTYIGERSPVGSTNVEARVRRALAHIATHPLAAQQVEQRPSVRRLPLTPYPYVIFYRPGPSEIAILRIVHGARREAIR